MVPGKNHFSYSYSGIHSIEAAVAEVLYYMYHFLDIKLTYWAIRVLSYCTALACIYTSVAYMKSYVMHFLETVQDISKNVHF